MEVEPPVSVFVEQKPTEVQLTFEPFVNGCLVNDRHCLLENGRYFSNPFGYRSIVMPLGELMLPPCLPDFIEW